MTVWECLNKYACHGAILTPRGASELAFDLRGFATWFLSPETLDLAARAAGVHRIFREAWRRRPSLAMGPGVCSILFVLSERERERFPWARRTFALPLQWAARSAHDPCLPVSLHKLADRVRLVVQAEHDTVAPYRLQLAECVAGLRFHDFALKPESGWAPLAGSLLALSGKAAVNARVWATGAWQEGIVNVDDLADKVALAEDWDAAQLFVPQRQVESAEKLRRDVRLLIRPLQQGQIKVGLALRDFLRALEVPPPRSAPRADRRQYFMEKTDNEDKERYYYENLFPDILDSCRELAARLPRPAPVRAFVTIISDGFELIPIALESLQPERTLMLFTKNYRDRFEKARDLVRRHTGFDPDDPCRVQPAVFDDTSDLLAGMKKAVAGFLGDVPAAECVLDLTGGSKEMTIQLLLKVACTGNRLYYLRHGRAGRHVIPFTETPCLIQVD